MKLSEYAKHVGVHYKTAWNWYKAGKIKGAYATESGTIIVPNDAYMSMLDEDELLDSITDADDIKEKIKNNELSSDEIYECGYKIVKNTEHFNKQSTIQQTLGKHVIKNGTVDNTFFANNSSIYSNNMKVINDLLNINDDFYLDCYIKLATSAENVLTDVYDFKVGAINLIPTNKYSDILEIYDDKDNVILTIDTANIVSVDTNESDTIFTIDIKESNSRRYYRNK